MIYRLFLGIVTIRNLSHIIMIIWLIFIYSIIEISGKEKQITNLILPPKYLQIKDFKKCLNVKQQDTYYYYCLPANKPKLCPQNSWEQLTLMDLLPC